MQSMPDFSALLRIAQSPAGQKLLAMLQTGNPGDLDSITAAAASGNLEEAKQKMSSLLSGKDAQELLNQLGKQL